MRAAGVAVGTDAGVVDGAVADGAVASDGGQWTLRAIVMVELGHRQGVADCTAAACQLYRAVAVPAWLGLNHVVEDHGLGVMLAQAAGVAPRTANVGRFRTGMAFTAGARLVGVGRVMLRDNGRLASADMAVGTILLQGAAIHRFVAGCARSGCVGSGHMVPGT